MACAIRSALEVQDAKTRGRLRLEGYFNVSSTEHTETCRLRSPYFFHLKAA